ncbi:NADPH-dependent FMN reductase [Clostridium cavendishii DSM 21758]|uniref:NADPH-dependent FMN reductase n=1 Tax=Clostridium cavendishii DSM 21758 TaxID=1121302 RepID=A0A1M6MI37_9CLOT|nr:flavodoxin family protein [Clostridium cavendishii]SHJ83098.1 NADPH-dependent FMN reductase [Clostridium cavendishii DSM 21758]
MNITIINGCREDNLFYVKVIEKLEEGLIKANINYKINNLNEVNPKNCIGCDCCQNVKPGICTINDGVNNILKQYLESDVLIIVSPIQFGMCNSVTKNFIDRTEPLFLPYQVEKNGRTAMKNRYDGYPDIIFIGIIKNKDVEAINNFKSTVLNCNLSEASSKADVKIVTDETDLSFLERLI